MKNSWQTKSLEEVCTFSNGLWKGEKPPFVNVGVIRNTNFTKEGMLDDSEVAYLDVEAKKFANRRLQFGDIILEKSGGGPKQAVGRVALFDKKDGDFSFSNFTAAIRVLDPRELHFRFLHRFLHWNYLSGVTEEMQSHSTGIRNLKGDAYKAIRISLPPIPEQHRIVRILDKAFEGIAAAKTNAKINLQNTRAIFESLTDGLFSEMRGCGSERRLIELSSKIGSGATPLGGEKSYKATGISLIRSLNVYDDGFRENGLAFIDVDQAAKLSNVEVRPGDVLLNITGASVARCCIVPERILPARVNQHVSIIRPVKELIVPKFLHYALSSRAYKEKLLGIGADGGSTRQAITKAEIEQFAIVCPKFLDEQQKAVDRLDNFAAKTQRLESVYQRMLAALEALKKSLLHQAFTGQL